MLSQLIELPSMSSVSPDFDTGNRAVIDTLANWLDALGFAVEITPLPHHPGKANLLARLGPVTPESRGLMLAGHTDTVPFDQHRWHHDPFRLTEADQRLYGLGTADMKGFFPLVIEAVKQFRAEDFQQPLFVLATADEESSMDGARVLVERGCPHVAYAIIGEPTGLTPVNAHKGMMMEAVRVVGRAGHSSNPALGVNAMEAMHRVVGEVLRWRADLQQRYRDDRFDVPVPTLNLGHIHGGDNPNRICDQCELHFDLRPVPGMSLTELHAELRQRVGSLFEHDDVQWEVFSLCHGTSPMHTPAQSPIVRFSEHACGAASRAVSFCTEGPYLAELGIETVILGPGDVAQAHQPDEYLALARIEPMVDVLSRAIDRFCVQG